MSTVRALINDLKNAPTKEITRKGPNNNSPPLHRNRMHGTKFVIQNAINSVQSLFFLVYLLAHVQINSLKFILYFSLAYLHLILKSSVLAVIGQ